MRKPIVRRRFLLIALGVALTGMESPGRAPADEPKPLSFQGHAAQVSSVTFSPDGKLLASGSSFLYLQGFEVLQGDIKLWDVETGKTKATLVTDLPGVRERAVNYRSVSFSPDGRLLAVGIGWMEWKGNKWGGQVRIWEVATGKEKAILEGHTDQVFAVRFSPDGRLLASCGDDMTVRLWDVQTMKEKAVLKGHTSRVAGVAFSPDGKTLASAGGFDNTVKLWDVATGQETTTLKGHEGFVSSVAFSPDGRTLVSGGADRTVRLWEVKTGMLTATLKGHKRAVHSAAFSPDGKSLASGGGESRRLDKVEGGGEVKVWDVETGKEVATAGGCEDLVTSVAFSPDGKRLAGGSLDGAVKLWEVSRLLPEPRKE